MVFTDRSDAGRKLAEAIAGVEGLRDPIILGLSPGGLRVARHVAHFLNAPLDIFLLRRLGLPGEPDIAMGAVGSGGATLLNRRMLEILGIDETRVRQVIERERAELSRCENRYRKEHSRLSVFGREVMIVDDGMSMGATMSAAVRTLYRAGAARVVVAVPMCPADALRFLRSVADDVICLFSPAYFMSPSLWYRNFDEVTEEEARSDLDQARSGLLAIPAA